MAPPPPRTTAQSGSGPLPARSLAALRDEELMRRVVRGEAEAFEALYARYSRLVYAIAVRVLGSGPEAQEATQEAFLDLWRSRERFRPDRGALQHWLARLARNRAIDLARRSVPAAADADDPAVAGALADAGEHPDAAVLRTELQRTLRSQVAQLPAGQRQAISLAYFGGMTSAEIARHSGLPLGTVKSRVRLGLANLRTRSSALAA